MFVLKLTNKIKKIFVVIRSIRKKISNKNRNFFYKLVLRKL